MSASRAIKQREEMNSTYESMLKDETSTVRIEALKKAIKINDEEIEAIKKQQGKLFGKKEPIKQETIIVEYDRDSQSYKTTTIPKEPDKPVQVKVSDTHEAQGDTNSLEPNQTDDTSASSIQSGASDEPASSKANKKIGNKLRDSLKQKVAETTEDSLKAKVAAAKAAKSSSKKGKK